MAETNKGILFLSAPATPTTEIQARLIAAGYDVHPATTPAETLNLLMDEPVGVLLLDGRALSQFSERVLRHWQEHDPLMETIGLSAAERVEPALIRMDCRHVVKLPPEAGKLEALVRDAFAKRALRRALVGDDEEMADSVLRAVYSMVRAVELKDAYTRGRVDRVALFAGILASEVDGSDPELVRVAARVHDVGKIGVPEAILNKTDRLTDEEFEIVQRHPVHSWEMLRNLFSDNVVLGVARSHHERWDGKGYPDGLEGEAIPVAARMVAIADSLDALTSARAFRKALLWSDAVKEIIAGAGTRYDPALIEVFDRAQERLLLGR